jgi:hypothetical protein
MNDINPKVLVVNFCGVLATFMIVTWGFAFVFGFTVIYPTAVHPFYHLNLAIGPLQIGLSKRGSL